MWHLREDVYMWRTDRMLRLNKVKKEYKGFQLDCTLEVQEGCVTGLIGKNGAGKSTTFKAILGLISTEIGRAHV